jgi:hypothetical protein
MLVRGPAAFSLLSQARPGGTGFDDLQPNLLERATQYSPEHWFIVHQEHSRVRTRGVVGRGPIDVHGSLMVAPMQQLCRDGGAMLQLRGGSKHGPTSRVVLYKAWRIAPGVASLSSMSR